MAGVEVRQRRQPSIPLLMPLSEPRAHLPRRKSTSPFPSRFYPVIQPSPSPLSSWKLLSGAQQLSYCRTWRRKKKYFQLDPGSLGDPGRDDVSMERRPFSPGKIRFSSVGSYVRRRHGSAANFFGPVIRLLAKRPLVKGIGRKLRLEMSSKFRGDWFRC